jgi:hypothetical protein
MGPRRKTGALRVGGRATISGANWGKASDFAGVGMTRTFVVSIVRAMAVMPLAPFRADLDRSIQPAVTGSADHRTGDRRPVELKMRGMRL